ncbi:MAG: ribonuclease P [Nanoarchaeota archaeon]
MPLKEEKKRVALLRVKQLFNEAEKEFKKHPERSDRYVQLARKIAMKVNLKLPKDLKRKFCRHCYSYLKPNVNVRVRIRKGKVIYYCFNCKKYMRYVL